MQKIDIYLINNRKIINTIFQLQQTSNINYKLITCVNNKVKMSFKYLYLSIILIAYNYTSLYYFGTNVSFL